MLSGCDQFKFTQNNETLIQQLQARGLTGAPPTLYLGAPPETDVNRARPGHV